MKLKDKKRKKRKGPGGRNDERGCPKKKKKTLGIHPCGK
jgi:hypothetical protein